jgi:multidrug efflux pump subunit AcrB
LGSQPAFVLVALFAVYIVPGVCMRVFRTSVAIPSIFRSTELGEHLLLWMWQLDSSAVAMISAILLIGIMKKRILVVGFALSARNPDGLVVSKAIYEAAV